ncbi:MAG: GlxA family transcriptional regulator [Deltaproteobacteria bacterium]|nr:GlxA family transcriptional regulator [Deltaproteobacteria bacterium]
MENKKVIQVIFNGSQILDITGPMEVFAQANEILSKNGDFFYDLSLISHKKGPVSTSSGLKLLAEEDFKSFNSSNLLDTLLIAGGNGVYQARFQKDLIDFVREHGKNAMRIASICSGTFILAEAGLLDGKQATTHWSVTEKLALEYPEIDVKPDNIFIRDGNIYSSAGVTAGIDLALSLVEEDHGRKIALEIAKQLVVFMKRQGGQSQFSTTLIGQYAARGVLKDILKWIKQNPKQDMSVDALALRCAMSERNFARVFKQEVGMTPGRYVEKMRVEYAAELIESRGDDFHKIASTSGFSSDEMMRRAFMRQLNVLPNSYRKRFGIKRREEK